MRGKRYSLYQFLDFENRNSFHFLTLFTTLCSKIEYSDHFYVADHLNHLQVEIRALGKFMKWAI